MSDFRDAIASDDRRGALNALRDQIAAKLDAGECRHCGGPRGEAAGLASLALRLMKIFEALDALPDEREVSKRDDLAAKRTIRRHGVSATSDHADADRGSQQRGPGSH